MRDPWYVYFGLDRIESSNQRVVTDVLGGWVGGGGGGGGGGMIWWWWGDLMIG